MTLDEKLYQASKYLEAILRIFAPKDSTNLAKNAIRSARRFDVSQIGKQWIQLFEEVKLEKTNKI
jgi:hypothetical protein